MLTSKLNPSQPIGVFDSGTGGLTIARALINLLPNENIIYFGDTVHFPYGDKSQEAVKSYSQKITNMLLEKKCKCILIACNSASAAAYDVLKDELIKKVLMLNVIDPLIEFLNINYSGKNVGLIATKLTVKSRIYEKKINNTNSNIKISSLATPLITSIIEEGFHKHKIVDEALDIYLNDPKLSNINAIVLGCTHYPLIKDQISAFYKNKIDVLDASIIVANKVKLSLEKYNLLNTNKKILQQFYVSDYTEAFANHAKLFFGEDINLENYPLF